MLGDSVAFSRVKEIEFTINHLQAGDLVQVVTANGSTPILPKAETDGKLHATYTMVEPGFVRVEVWRGFLPGLPLLPALISNPIYFEA